MTHRITLLLLILAGLSQPARPDKPFGIESRVPWATSRISGSPDPPSPYRTERTSALFYEQPVAMATNSATGRTYVVERKGKIAHHPDDPAAESSDMLLNGARQIEGLTAIYGLAFHPKFEQNRYCYVCYILKQGLPEGTRVSRFTVTDDDPPRIDPDSERVLLTWKSGGHNGGCLKFGPDGYLYISTGDGSPPAPPDELKTGQDISDLLASVLRIDVDRRQDGKPYGIPQDNPFVSTEGARPEIWAYGFRNPWRMNFDRKTGDLWLGDVGWQLWEMVYRVERAGNYGWSIVEGPQDVHPEWDRGPTAIQPPVVAHPRAEAASVTGGFVYRGKRLKELTGCYIYGDYVTGRIWSLRYKNGKVTERKELADTPYAIISFHEDKDGELSFMDYNGGEIYRLVPNENRSDPRKAFPRRLSKTGLFESVRDHMPAPGVVPFSVAAKQWMDSATAERFVAVPGDGKVVLRKPEGRVPTDWGDFPEDTVLVKTISLELEKGNPESRRRIETQILHTRGPAWRGNSGEWFGYTYVWNKDQTEAELAPADGLDLEFTVTDGGKKQRVPWRIWGRSQCYLCHNPWAGYRLGFTASQLNHLHDYGQVRDNQLRTLRHIELLEVEDLNAHARLVDPHDLAYELQERVRSYLHVNCAHCHRFGGGGTARIDLRAELPLAETKMIGERPTQGAFGIHDGQIIRPGDPESSLLFYRIRKTGKGRMPHIGSVSIDRHFTPFIRNWIQRLQVTPLEKVVTDRMAREALDVIRVISNADSNGKALTRMLDSTSGALRLQFALDSSRDRMLPAHYASIIAEVAKVTRPEVRDLFEPYLPEELRTKRLGTAVKTREILALEGNQLNGSDIFKAAKGLQCRNCHRLDEEPGGLGPSFAGIGRQRTREQLLESILEPSKKIDPKFQTWLVETSTGRVHTGLLIERTDSRIVLKTEPKKDVTLQADEVDRLVPQRKSMMPEMQFRDLTAQQLADLLAFLESLK